MQLLNGKTIADQIKHEIAAEVADMLDKSISAPHIAAVLVGEDPASQTYVAGKERACREVGFLSSVYRYPDTISEDQLLEIVDFLNGDPEIDGFIIQLPLPKHIHEQTVIERIDPRKDIDGFHPVNVGKMVLNIPSFLPATPYGIVTLLDRYNIETEGKHCVVLGRSNIVGTPISILMSRKTQRGNSTVTLCHSFTNDIAEITRKADILIVAMGKCEFVTAEMIKKDAVVIDVGIHRVPSKESKSGFILKGDVKFDEVSKKCSFITPVPGGVGLMTTASLLLNALKAAKKEFK